MPPLQRRRQSSAASQSEQPRQPQRQRRQIGHQHQNAEHHAVERPDAAQHLFDGDVADGAADEQNRADRRVAQPDAEIEHHDHAVEIRIDGAMSTSVPSKSSSKFTSIRMMYLLLEMARKNAVILAGICVSAMM